VTERVPEALPSLMADLVGFAPSVAHVVLRKELGLGIQHVLH
jgi:hypothetical protein